MNAWVYDEETIKNFFLICFQNIETKERVKFIIDETTNDRNSLIKFVKDKWLIGYNNHFFDDVVLNYIILKERTVDEVYEFSQYVIKGEKSDSENYYNKIRKYKYSNLYKSIDLIRLLFSKKLRVKLKELQITMKYPNVQELPHKFYEVHNEQMKLDQIEYCWNDVNSTNVLYNLSVEDLKLRHNIKKEFGLDCYSKDGVKTGVDLFFKLYCKESGLDPNIVKDLRTHRESINLGDVILDKISFKSKEFNNLLNTLKNTTITSTKGSLDYSVLYGGVMHVYGTGGLHSLDPSDVIEPAEDELYIDADVNSLYPAILIEYGFKPEHLTNEFLTVYKRLRDDRIRAKKAGNKLIAETYKLSLNGSYGNLIQPHSWLCDPKAAMGITLNGQLFLSMLSEQFTDAGFKVDSINTDGITVIIKKDREKDYYRICKEWEELTKLELEFAYYKKVVRLDVNDYFAVYSDNKIKHKGTFIPDIRIGKGYDKPIIGKAIVAHFTKGIPFDEFIRSHNDIYDFLMSQRVGDQYEVEWNGMPTQHINRYYVSKRGAYLYKIKDKGSPKESKQHLLKGFGVKLFNKYEEKPMKEYDIYYEYYISECRKLILQLEPKQLNLFD